jgi:hypothetical protein
MKKKPKLSVFVASVALLATASCTERRVDPLELKPDHQLYGWLYRAAEKVHRANLRPDSGLHGARYRIFRIGGRDHVCAWVFYDEPNLSYTGSDFVYCFDSETEKFAFRL